MTFRHMSSDDKVKDKEQKEESTLVKSGYSCYGVYCFLISFPNQKQPYWVIFKGKTKYKILYFDSVVLEIYLDHKFQWPYEGLQCESLA